MSKGIPAFSGTKFFHYTTNNIERSVFLYTWVTNPQHFSVPVRPEWGDGAAAGSGAVGAVAGCEGRELGRNLVHPRGSGVPCPPVLKAGWMEVVSLCGSPACQMTEEKQKEMFRWQKSGLLDAACMKGRSYLFLFDYFVDYTIEFYNHNQDVMATLHQCN